MTSTSQSVVVPAPPAVVFKALVDPDAVAVWRVPEDMTAEVHELDARAGGRIRMSLTYVDPQRAGKSDGATDTYAGTFLDVVPGERVVEEVAFETDDPGVQGTFTMTTTLRATDGGTEVTIAFGGMPEGVDPADNQTGARMALDKLADLVGLVG